MISTVKKKILLVSSSLDWSFNERNLLRDVIALSEYDIDVFLIKNSPLHKKILAMNLNVNVISMNYLSGNIFFRWRYIKKILSDPSVYSCVHCYSIEILWYFCYILRDYSSISLSFFLDQELTRSYKKVWFRPLSRRIDGVIVPSEGHIENLWYQMRVHPRKCLVNTLSINQDTRLLDFTSTSISRIGFYISLQNRNYENLKRIKDCFDLILKRLEGGKEIRFVLYVDSDFYDDFSNKDFKYSLLKIFDLGEQIEIREFKGLSPDVENLDLWVDFSSHNSTGYALDMIEKGVPIIVPRGILYSNIFYKFSFVGESYKLGDYRELQQKVLKVLSSQSIYLKLLRKSASKFSKQVNFQSYNKNLTLFLNGLTLRRKNYVKRSRL